MNLTSDVEQLIQRSQWGVNKIELRKVIARNNNQKTKKNFTGFYTKDDPKMAGYWPLSFFLRFYWPGLPLDPLKKNTCTHAKTTKSVANIQTSWPHAWSKTPCIYVERVSRFHHVATSLSSAVNFPGVARFCSCRFSPSVPSLMHEAAFARDLPYLVPKGITITPH